MISTMVIGGDKFSGKPGDWADIKTEMSAIETPTSRKWVRIYSVQMDLATTVTSKTATVLQYTRKHGQA
jgi:hypothetical protein